MLIHTYLDKELKKEGVDPDSKKGKEKIKKVLTSESFKKITKTLAQARILGMQVYKTFEASPEGKQGEVGVVCIHSDKLQKMAEAMVPGSGVALPKQTSKKPILQQIPTDKRVLLSSYGIQQKIDENGDLVLVAFAQAQPATKSKTSQNAAFRKAKLSAMGLIRQFAGENAHVATAQKMAENYKEFEDESMNYQNDEAYREQVKTYSKKMKISGISTIKKWRYEHPLTGSTVVGVVCTWSPRSALRAKSLKNKMEVTPTPKKKNQESTVSPTTKIGEGQKGKYKGEGKEGDKDAF